MQFKEYMLAARSATMSISEPSGGMSETTINLLIAVFALVFVGLLLVAVLMLLRRMKRQQMMSMGGDVLPQYHDAKRSPNHRRLTIQTSTDGRHSVLVVGGNGQHSPMLANPHSPPHSPDNVPDIHITFPDEHDDQGRRKSGRVVVVRVGESGTVGMAPLHDDEQLPAYEKENKSQFYSIDIEKIGGLKEKEHY